jgi:uncharacterized membrane protein YhaH (DUF805 family)
MEQDSPYTAPRAGYASGKDHIIYEDIRPLSFSQRLNRLRYACYQLTTALIMACIGILMAVFAGASEAINPLGKTAVLVVGGLLILVLLVYLVVLAVRRLHDLGHSGWLVLVWIAAGFAPLAIAMAGMGATAMLLASVIQPLMTLYLLAAAGTPGMNPYGTPNPPNGLLVKIFGGLFWALMVIGMLFNLAILVFGVLAPDLLGNLPVQDPQQQWQELERLLRGTGGR